MAQGTIKVTPEELRRSSEKIRSLADQYKTLYEKDLLSTELGEMRNAYWGDDAQTYAQRVEGFKTNFDQMYRLMTDYADLLKKAAELYDQQRDDLKAKAASK